MRTQEKILKCRLTTCNCQFSVKQGLGKEKVIRCFDNSSKKSFKFLYHVDRCQESQILLWDLHVKGINCGEEATKWISNFVLGKDNGANLLFHHG